MFLLYPNGSVLLLSERESEHVFEQLSKPASTSATGRGHWPCLVHLAFVRDAVPGDARDLRIPLLAGAPPPPRAWREAVRNVVALQLFAGETEYRRGDCRGYRATTAAQDAARMELVGDIVLGSALPSTPRGALTLFRLLRQRGRTGM